MTTQLHQSERPRLHILWGPQNREATGKYETRWCFKCRKRTRHQWHVSYDEEPSYYEPVGSLLCPECGEEHIYFPGCEPW